MNSNYGRSNQSGSRNAFDFDLGLNSNRSKPLKDQKNKPSPYTSSFSSTQPKPDPTTFWQPNKPSWTHQPAPSQASNPGSLAGPTSMVGDITGRSWASSAPPVSSNGIGIVNKSPNLFSDLLGSNLGQNKSNSNVPLKSAAPVSANKSAYSMGGMANSLPKTSNSGSQQNIGGYGTTVNSNRNQNLGGQSMKSSIGGGISANKDPFGSLVDFSAKPAGGGMKTGIKANDKGKPGDVFGDFQNAPKLNANDYGGSNNAYGNDKGKPVDDAFGNFQNAPKSSANAFGGSNNSFTGSSSGGFSNMDDFSGIPSMKNQVPVQSSSGVDSFDVLFTSSSVSVGNDAKGSQDQFSGAEDWGDFGGGDDVGGTIELEGLPPPPSGVTGSSAKNKGMENYKQGQYPDAIKWLSWAVFLLEKAGDSAGTTEVLSSRASCYKEVGEYKKAVADCTQILEQDGKNVSVLVQRALLYESMEKYKLGAEDLRSVMKIDPGNRVARSTIHRLTQMAG